jgi:hypothetical protein
MIIELGTVSEETKDTFIPSGLDEFAYRAV